MPLFCSARDGLCTEPYYVRAKLHLHARTTPNITAYACDGTDADGTAALQTGRCAQSHAEERGFGFSALHKLSCRTRFAWWVRGCWEGDICACCDHGLCRRQDFTFDPNYVEYGGKVHGTRSLFAWQLKAIRQCTHARLRPSESGIFSFRSTYTHSQIQTYTKCPCTTL